MDRPIRWLDWLSAFALAVALSYWFWSPLWSGGGFVGGDVYTYFLPQKQFLAESLQQGVWPLWHSRTSFGYPLVAESQTGVFYPPNWVLYRWLDCSVAYHVSHLAHFVVATMGMWRLAREWKLSQLSALLAAVIYVYAWFPPRSCLEWAIIGGCYLPFALLLVERLLSRSSRWAWSLLALVLALQMTAGHFHLAFITQLTALSYAVLRLYFVGPSDLWKADKNDWGAVAELESKARTRCPCDLSPRPRWHSLVLVITSLCCAFAMAAVQLLPTWELKLSSQRQTTNRPEFDPGYGHIPPLYLTQVVASWWWWYDQEINRDQALIDLKFGAIASGTNQVEAHLYLGLLPIALIAFSLLHPHVRAVCFDRAGWMWVLLAVVAVIYATGWLLPITRHLPGFSFFRGLGRFGIVTTLAGALLAARALEALLVRWSSRWQWVVTVLVIGLTAADFKVVADNVRYTSTLETSPYAFLSYSPAAAFFRESKQLARLDAPGANLTNLLGVSSVPEYLGLGPIEYYDLPTQARALEATHPSAQNMSWAERMTKYLDWAESAGVTHVLMYDRISTLDFEDRIRLIVREPDDFLNLAWARARFEPFWLYELPQSRGRASATHPDDGSVTITAHEPNRVTLEVDLKRDSTVILRDLMYPGWTVTIDDEPATAERVDRIFRGVVVPAGQHRIAWRFRPTHFSWAICLSVCGLLICCLYPVVVSRRQTQRIVP